MKTIKLLFAGLFLITLSANAQVSVNVNINTPAPAWGPVGYAEARYYYIPDIEVYYDIPSAMFIYFDGGGWIRAAYLPYRYRHYDLYGAYKVCLHDYGPNPYVYYKHHKVKYCHGYKGPYQRTIGDRPHVVYNGPRDGYHNHRDDDHNDSYRSDYQRNDNDNQGNRRHDDYRTEYRSSDNGYTRNNEGHGNGRGNGGNGRGNGHGNGGHGNGGHGNGGGRGHGQRG